MTVTPHQLRRSAELMDLETKARTGWADTSDRAEHMRAAADRIEELERALLVAKGRLTWAANTHPDPKKARFLREWADT